MAAQQQQQLLQEANSKEDGNRWQQKQQQQEQQQQQQQGYLRCPLGLACLFSTSLAARFAVVVVAALLLLPCCCWLLAAFSSYTPLIRGLFCLSLLLLLAPFLPCLAADVAIAASLLQRRQPAAILMPHYSSYSV